MSNLKRIKKLLLCISWLLFSATVFAQSGTLKINFVPVYNGQVLKAGKSYYAAALNDSVRIDVFRIYISGMELLQHGQPMWKETDSYHLMDLEDSSTFQLKAARPASAFNAIRFNIGIDSAKNVSGAMGGDLDPTKGMYWTWQSGYINCKLEGTSNVCQSRSHAFQFHLGGYMHPYNSLQTVSLPLKSAQTITIYIDIGNFIGQVNLPVNTGTMSPGKLAVDLSEKLAKVFKTKW
jgi:hypothetical protein